MSDEQESKVFDGKFKYIKPISKYAPFVFAGGVAGVTRDFYMAASVLFLTGVCRHLGRGEGIFDTVKGMENDPLLHKAFESLKKEEAKETSPKPTLEP